MSDDAGAVSALTALQDRLDDEMCTWPAEPTLYTRANAVDQWPSPMTPLTQDLIAYPQERGLGKAFGRELETAAEGDAWTWNGVFYGWYTYCVGPAAEMADNLPGYSRAAVYSDYFGVTEDPDAPPVHAKGASPAALAKIGWNFLRVIRTYPKHATRMMDKARARLRTDLTLDWPAVPDEALAARLSGHVEEATEFRVPHAEASVLSASLFQNASKLVRKLDPEHGDTLLTEALSGLGGIHLREATRAMGEVAAGRLSREDFLDQYGFRGANEFELAALPWRDDPATVDRLIAAAATERPDTAAESRERARARLRELAGPRWPMVRWLLGFLETHLRWRENGKVPMALATHSMRLLTREVGRRLVERGRIGEPDDVFYLRLDELIGELSGHETPELDKAVKRRRQTIELSATLPLPEMLDVRPGLLEQIGPARWASMGVLPPKPPSSDGSQLVGVGGAPGTATGRARIVFDPNEVELEEGDVIVARGTDSAWTPLFFQAAAVVIDVGGVMSHPAIAAREVGIPCVVNVKTGTTQVTEGQSITVDGNAGRVELH